jgi:hypothetical protein
MATPRDSCVAAGYSVGLVVGQEQYQLADSFGSGQIQQVPVPEK